MSLDLDARRRRAALHMNRKRAALAAGTWQPYVPPNRARYRLKRLHKAGYSTHALSAAFGISECAVKDVLTGSSRQIRPATERAIMTGSLDPRRIPPGFLISAVGTKRRVYALNRMGWCYAALAEHIGVAPRGVSQFMTRRTIGAARAAAVADAYEKLSNIPGPSNVSLLRASREGHMGPLFWDDKPIDDPTYWHPLDKVR